MARIARVVLSRQFLKDALDLPDNATISNVRYEAFMQRVELLVECPDFDDVPDATEIPTVATRLSTVVTKALKFEGWEKLPR